MFTTSAPNFTMALDALLYFLDPCPLGFTCYGSPTPFISLFDVSPTFRDILLLI